MDEVAVGVAVVVLLAVIFIVYLASKAPKCARPECRHVSGLHKGRAASCTSKTVINPAGTHVKEPCDCPGWKAPDA